MRIAIVTPYWSPVLGGITTYVRCLTAELRRSQKFDTHVIARDGCAESDVSIVGGSPSQFIRWAAAALDRLGPEVIHAHGHWYTLAAGLRYQRRHPGVRVIFTLHTPFPPLSWWRHFALRVILSRADFVTGVSAHLLGTTLRTIGFRTRTRVTYPGVSVASASSQEIDEFRKSISLGLRRPIVAFLGRLVWDEKVRGVANLIRAMKSVREAFPSATLLIAGDGPQRKALEELAAREAPGGVIFLGDVTDPTPRFYGTADVYTHISFQEGLPLAILEAMACERPVIATAVGGIPEVVRDGETGFLVSGDPVEVSARIVEVLSSPELARRVAANAAVDVGARFTCWDATERFLPLYGAASRHRVAVTVDLERDYYVTPSSFHGIAGAMPKILDLFEDNGIRATVFATSDVCEMFPKTLAEISRRGHSIECHGESHDVEYLSSRTYKWQFESLRRATEAIKGCTGVRPRGFRAPNFSANGNTIKALEELGYAYDSSVLPGRHVRARRLTRLVDFRMAPRDPYHPSRDDPALPGSSNLWELPVAENPLAPGGPIGLAYINMFGVDSGLEALERSAAEPCVLLIHPWELIDPPSGSIPRWMRAGCSSDASKLASFLHRVGEKHEITTLDAEIARVR